MRAPSPWLGSWGASEGPGCLVGWRRVPHAQPSRISPFTQFQSNAALFEAVELQDLDRVQEMLKHYSPEELDLNTPNSEGLLPLDIAIMTNNAPIARALLQAGAKESPHCKLGQGPVLCPPPGSPVWCSGATTGTGCRWGGDDWALGESRGTVYSDVTVRDTKKTHQSGRSRKKKIHFIMI